MNFRIRCARHNQILKIFTSYESNGETILDVTPCPECVAQQSVQPTYWTLPASEVYTTPENFPAPVVRLDPPISG